MLTIDVVAYILTFCLADGASCDKEKFIGGTMALFDSLIDDLASRFGLGPTATPLVRETLKLILGSTDGLSGFISRLTASGLGSVAASWLGASDPAPLSTQQVETAIGYPSLSGIADRLGLNTSIVTSAIGYALPKLIGLLTPGGSVPASLPAAVANFLQDGAAPAPAQTSVSTPGGQRTSLLPLAIGAAALIGGVSWFLAQKEKNAGEAPPAIVTEAPGVSGGASSTAVVQTLPAQLSITDDGRHIAYSGAVHDDATRSSILDALKAVFGAKRLQGDIAVDANRGPAPWAEYLRKALEGLKALGIRTAGSQLVFEGPAITVGGTSPDETQTKISAALRNAMGGGFSVGGFADKVAGAVSDANAKVASALGALKTDFTAQELVDVLNKAIINFHTAESAVPKDAEGLLKNAAELIKKLPADIRLEISGHTDNVGDDRANQALSQRRADSIRSFLANAGVKRTAIQAKGYGSTRPVASNDTPEGRFQNRRIEYHVVH
jgi:OOP family OmpA-OmpF porin